MSEFGCQSYAPLRVERLRGVLDRVETRKLPQAGRRHCQSS
ncbi:hypothetical protein AB0H83_12845 [Dactylosporangium sp. NPDC050688]